MNATKLAVGTLAGLLACVQNTFAIEVGALPVEDGGLLLVAAVGLVVAVKIVRWKQKR